MMSIYDADPQELARRTKVLEEVNKGVSAIFDGHDTAVERIGNVWGTDPMGEEFYRRYGPNAQDFYDYAHNLMLGVRTSVDAVVETARRIQRTEVDNTEQSRNRRP